MSSPYEKGVRAICVPPKYRASWLFIFIGDQSDAPSEPESGSAISRAHLAAFEDYGIVHLLMCDVLREFRSEIDVQVGPRHREAYEVRLTEV